MKSRTRKVDLAWEPVWRLLKDGLADLVRQHHAEVGVYKDRMPLDCDWAEYQRLDNLGLLHTLSARLRGRLIGYSSFFVRPHIHYHGTLHALGDAIYVLPQFRRTGAGIFLVDRAERDLPLLAGKGWCRIIYHDKAYLEHLAPILKRRGYTHQENVWDKMVAGHGDRGGHRRGGSGGQSR